MSIRRAGLVLPLLVSSIACDKPPPAPTTAPSASASAVVAPPAPYATPAAFASLRDELLDGWLKDDPSWARVLGLHDIGDGKVSNVSAVGIEAREKRLDDAKARLAAIDATKLSPDDALDLAMLKSRADLTLFWLRDMNSAARNPSFYEELFTLNQYLDRDYEPIEKRALALVLHEEAALAALPEVRKNLDPVLPQPIVETAIGIFKGFVSYLKTDVPTQLKGVGDAAFQARFKKSNDALAKAADDLATYFKKEAMPKADQNFVLGEAKFRALLKAQENLDTPLAELEKVAEDDLAKNRTAFEAIEKSLAGKPLARSTSKTLFADATKEMEAARAFLIEKKIVTLATEDTAIVKESPPFMRWNSAFLDMSGPFDPVRGAFYYITLPDPTWPKKEQDDYLLTKGTMMSTTVHEVYPGHFVQGRWMEKAPSRTQKMSDSYSFVEGWAHYVEQMMLEEGYGAGDPEIRLGQLSDALLRNCRYVVAIGLHTKGMTVAQAEKRFHDECHQDKANAHQQAVRGTFDPGYFAYTLGKLQIIALREEAKKALGPAFSLQKFHDAVLSHGQPAMALIHDRVLSDLGATAKQP